MAQTLFDKIWNKHVVNTHSGFPDTLYIDTHFVNKGTSARAFEGLRRRDIKVFRPGQTVVVAEPEYSSHIPLTDEARFQLDLLNKNCADFDLELPEKGKFCNNDCILALPGQLIVCDPDSTDNLGALGILAVGINEAQVEQVLATQCLLQQRPKTMKIEVNGRLAKGLASKDIIHYLISEISSDGAAGYYVEFAGDTILALDMAGRMAVCNISKEIGALGAIISPDNAAYSYICEMGLMSEPELTSLESSDQFLLSDESAVFDEVIEFDAEDILPGNYAIDLSKLIQFNNSKEEKPVSYETAGILEGYNDTDYILGQLDTIAGYEKLQAQKHLME